MAHSGLFALLQVQNEQDLNTVCQIAAHNSSNFDDEDAINYVKNLLSVDRYDAKRTLASIKALVALKSPESIRSHIPEKFPKDMADKVANTIASSAKRESAIESGYMPQLKDFTWRVDVKVASDAASRISVPTCLLQLNIRDPPTEVGKLEEESKINVELTKEAMETVLDGLGKIRDQLSNISK